MVTNISHNSTAESARRGSSDSGNVNLLPGSVEISVLLNFSPQISSPPDSPVWPMFFAARCSSTPFITSAVTQVRSRRGPPSVRVQCVAATFGVSSTTTPTSLRTARALRSRCGAAKRTAAICSHCHQPVPGYDQLAERCFEFDRRARWPSDQLNELAQSRAEPPRHFRNGEKPGCFDTLALRTDLGNLEDYAAGRACPSEVVAEVSPGSERMKSCGGRAPRRRFYAWGNHPCSR